MFQTWRGQRAEDLATRFTMLCLRGRWDPTVLEAARVLAHTGGFNWDAWYEAVQAEVLSPLLYCILRGQQIAPAAIEKMLKTAYYRNAVRNSLAFRELGRALRQLATEGVPVVLLKGAALAETVYHNIAARPMGDLDLLVHRTDAPAALRVFAALGYASPDVEAQAGAAVEFENEVMLRRPGAADPPIEVHWSLVDSPYYQHRLPMTWFWETALPAQVDRAAALVLGPEAQLLHLCAHLALHHGGEGVLWLHDVAEVLRFYEDRLNWELLLAKAGECDLVLPLQQVLPRVVDEWAAPAPSQALALLGALEPSPEEVRVFNWLTARERPVAWRFWADLASMPNWRQRLRYGLGNLFPSPAYMQHRYRISHPLLLALYYPYRWLIGLRGVVFHS